MRSALGLVSLAAALGLAGCGGADGGMQNPDVDGAVTPTVDGGPQPTGEVIVTHPVGRMVAAGEEVEVCEVVDLTNDAPLKAHSFKLTIDGVSHHAIVQLVMPSPSNPYSNGTVRPG